MYSITLSTTSLRVWGSPGTFSVTARHLCVAVRACSSINLPYIFTPSINVRQANPVPAFQLCSPPKGFEEVCPVADTTGVTFDAHGGILINGVPQRSGLGGFDFNYKMTQVEAWTLSVQQE